MIIWWHLKGFIMPLDTEDEKILRNQMLDILRDDLDHLKNALICNTHPSAIKLYNDIKAVEKIIFSL
jgi:hypothetical protein